MSRSSEQERAAGHERYRAQIARGVVWQLAVEKFSRCQWPIARQADGVTIFGFRDKIHANIAASTRLVVHNHALPQGFGERLN